MLDRTPNVSSNEGPVSVGCGFLLVASYFLLVVCYFLLVIRYIYVQVYGKVAVGWCTLK